MILARLILGLLTLAPMTGYDLKRHFDASIGHVWNADKAQIYRTLGQLVETGMAVVKVVPQENYPDRKEHHITDAGRGALRAWLNAEPDAEPAREPFLGRIFFAGELERDAVVLLLQERRARVAAQLEDYRGQRAELGDLEGFDRRAYLMAATLERSIGHAESELRWLRQVERNLP
ncbi:PadR family transcriptional regulator [Zhihengliuella sp.]|uniref:PadR family transcriptional regulator n=1 Tax=Zhihengliuella sp. TaxID=1954483 RepID=UPI002811D0AA|nr:PadR family transcriptional regulator [Zhihengliuella sp.]